MRTMNQPDTANPKPDSAKTEEDVELNDAEVQKIDGGAFDAYLTFPPAPKHG